MQRMLIADWNNLPPGIRLVRDGIPLVKDPPRPNGSERLIPLDLESYMKRDARAAGQYAGDHAWGFWLEEGTPEWEAAWGEIERLYGSTLCLDLTTGEAWQYVGTEAVERIPHGTDERPDGLGNREELFAGASPTLGFFHCFRHRALNGGARCHEWIPASPGWLPPEADGGNAG